ncbi:MAG: hypothetical protein ABI321_21970 [Polyangia bacterium]
MNRTNARWILAAAIGLLAVVQSLRTLPSLSSHAPLGAAALLALAVLTVAGLVSLWNARRRVDRELSGLSQRPATGELVEARRSRLAQIAQGGGTPDLATLAEATAAHQRGQAYLGRYLVAVAVLIGLIGTFAGLAEALRALPSILGGASDPSKLASLLSVPLAGLDVVFAAGIVGILATLSLSLAQGDLQLAEDNMLARLEEETTHELIPALWPRTHSVEERMLRELALLREENRTLLIEASAAIATRVAEVTARTSTDVAARLTAAVESSTSKLAEGVQRGFADAMRAHGEASTILRTDGAAQLATLKQGGEALVQLATRSASALETRLATEAGHISSALEKTHTAQQRLGEALRLSAEQSALLVGAKLETLTAQLNDQSIATQRVLLEGASESGRIAAVAVESLRAQLSSGLESERVALVGGLDSTRSALVEQLSSVRDGLVVELAAVRTGLVNELSGARIELGASLYAATDALRGEASSARAALDEASARAITSMERSVEAVSSVVGEVNQSMGSQATLAAELISESAARAQESLSTSTAAAQRAMLDGLSQAQLAIAEGVSDAKLALVEGATQVNGVLAASVTRAEKALSEGALALSAAASEEMSITRAAIVEATHDAHALLASSLETALGRLDTLLATSRSELGETLGAGREAVDRLVADSVGALSTSATLLAASADVLSRTGDQLGPQLESLAPELRLLSEEVALLGARTQQTDEPLFADELVRLGEGMERLEALVKLAQSHGEQAQS